MKQTVFVRTLRLTALLEGISFLILLGIAMPLKYYWDLPEMVRIVGMAHGILFLAYVYFVIAAASHYKFNYKQTLIALAGSILPFGTFYADAKIFKHL